MNPRTSFMVLGLCVAVAVSGQAADSPGKPPKASPADYLWVTMLLRVKGLGPKSTPVPVSCAIDFNAATEALGTPGLVDEHSLRLICSKGQRRGEEVPLQFTPYPQTPAPNRQLLPGTPKEVSYLAEFPAGNKDATARVAGTLTWMVQGDSEYRLEFGIPKHGRAVQVPYPPYNLSTFDNAGRATPLRWHPRMQVRPQQLLEGKLSIYQDEELVTSQYAGPSAQEERDALATYRRPFLYPVNAPGQIPVTGFGKPHDPTGSHAHHYSFWIAHASVNGLDFWAERGVGKIFNLGFTTLEDGPVFCRTVQQTLWRAGDTNVLKETRELKFYLAEGSCRLIDLELQLTPTADRPVTFGKTSFGFVAVRVAPSLSPFDGGGLILNARGDRNEAAAHLKPAEWIDMSGPATPNKWAGIAILDHPANVNHPTTWHCRNDGWAGAAFNYRQEYTLRPRDTLTLRYRLIAHTGDAAASAIAGRYLDFSHRPQVELGQARLKR